MLTDDERRQGAQLLFDAERQRRAIPQLSKTFPGIEIADAYRIQDLWAELKMAPGVGVAGHKMGLSSRAMQMASKMTEPDYGRIYDDAIYNDGAQIPAGRFLKPRLEVELAFVMGDDLEGPGKRIYDVMRAAEYVIPALEIIDYRTEVPRAITDTIADNAAFGAIVVGGRPIRPMDVDIRWVGATLSRRRELRPRSWATRPRASPGSSTSSTTLARSYREARSCSPVRSPARSTSPRAM
jgi:2-oxo-hept-3-ene-1,7-dioate hydratase